VAPLPCGDCKEAIGLGEPLADVVWPNAIVPTYHFFIHPRHLQEHPDRWVFDRSWETLAQPLEAYGP